jgi:hypothetical protein
MARGGWAGYLDIIHVRLKHLEDLSLGHAILLDAIILQEGA